MKTLYDFIHCEGTLTPSVVWYTVGIGTSHADECALKYIRKVAADSARFLFCKHTAELVQFKAKVAESIFTTDPQRGTVALSMLRQAYVSATWLSRFLRRFPLAMLNAPIVPTLDVETRVSITSGKPVHLNPKRQKPR